MNSISKKIYSDLSALFDAIQSLVFPMSWLHTFIPALPVSHRHYVDAPTPYLIGLLTDSSSSASNNNSVQHFLEEDFDYANSLVIRVDNMKGTFYEYLPSYTRKIRQGFLDS